MKISTHGLLALMLAVLLGLAPAAAQDEATPEATPPTGVTLRVWFPDALVSSAEGDATALLGRLVSEFEADHSGVSVDLRLKRAGDANTPGSLFRNLRSARAVAPGALPHLTLLRRSELVSAVREGLIARLPDDQQAALPGDLLPAAAPLGQFEGVLYGVPFMIRLLQQAAQPGTPFPESWSFKDVLGAEWRFAFPASQSNPVSDVLIAQLAEAGGLDAAGQLAPDAGTLAAVYQFYADAQAAGLLAPESLSATKPEDMLPLLVAADLPAAVVASSDDLRLREQGVDLVAAPLPTLNGGLASTLDGWVWVLPAGTPEERALARAFMVWMNEPTRQAEFARAVRQIPAGQDAFAAWTEGHYGTFITQLLDNGVLPLADLAESQPALARALQTGLTQVLSGSATPEQAAQTALSGAP